MKTLNMQKIFCATVLILVVMASCKPSYFSGRDKRTANKIVNWQVQHLPDSIRERMDWIHAALFRGMAEWADETNSNKIYTILKQIGEDNDWNMLPRVYDADDLCIAQTYFKLYDRYKDEKMIRNITERVNYVIAHPDSGAFITTKGKYYRNRWGWCDALFMAPPVYARLYQQTGNAKYLDFCFSEFKVTTDSLYDHNAQLFHRDRTLMNNRNTKGEKIFWGRGNGWVYAGLAFMLNTVPTTHPSYDYYLSLYRDMSKAIINCQDEKGSWHSSLLDKENYPQPENSASGFFTFGLAWGINNGILNDSSYRRAALSGWNSLKQYVDKNGKLGYIQPVGHAPKEITAEMTAPYGAGAYLLAATEIRKMSKK